MRNAVLLWAGLIALYLILVNSGGAARALSSLGTFVTGTTKALQGR